MGAIPAVMCRKLRLKIANFRTPRAADASNPRLRDARQKRLFDNLSMTQHPALEGLSIHQLEGRHGRLERELTNAFSIQPLPGALIERLVGELTATAREIDAMQSTSV